MSCSLSLWYCCLPDKREEELGSTWTALIMAGLSAILEAKRFNSSVPEEKHICQRSSELPWQEQGLLQWKPELPGAAMLLLPFLTPRIMGSWCPGKTIETHTHKKSLHWIATRLGGAYGAILQRVILGHGYHHSHYFSSAQSTTLSEPPRATALRACRTELSGFILPGSEIIWQICIFS